MCSAQPSLKAAILEKNRTRFRIDFLFVYCQSLTWVRCSFAIKSTLVCHQRSHLQKKMFRCHICDMMYSAKSSLKVCERSGCLHHCYLCVDRREGGGHLFAANSSLHSSLTVGSASRSCSSVFHCEEQLLLLSLLFASERDRSCFSVSLLFL